MTLLRSNWHPDSSAIKTNLPTIRMVIGPVLATPAFILSPPWYLKRPQEPGRGPERSNDVGIRSEETEVIAVGMVAYELRRRIDWRSKRGRRGRLNVEGPNFARGGTRG
jgi:hypothetical protein